MATYKTRKFHTWKMLKMSWCLRSHHEKGGEKAQLIGFFAKNSPWLCNYFISYLSANRFILRRNNTWFSMVTVTMKRF